MKHCSLTCKLPALRRTITSSRHVRLRSLARAFCRVSRRELDVDATTEFQPVLSGTSHLLLAPNEIVAVDIALYPSSTFFAGGASLELIVSASEIIPSRPYFKDATAASTSFTATASSTRTCLSRSSLSAARFERSIRGDSRAISLRIHPPLPG